MGSGRCMTSGFTPTSCSVSDSGARPRTPTGRIHEVEMRALLRDTGQNQSQAPVERAKVRVADREPATLRQRPWIGIVAVPQKLEPGIDFHAAHEPSI